MYYLALPGSDAAPGSDEYYTATTRRQEFWTRAQAAVAGGGLYPAAEAAIIRRDGDAASVTDGSGESTGMSGGYIGGYYVFDAADLDAALSLVRQIPEVSTGHVELWPMVDWSSTDQPIDTWWAALLREPLGSAVEPGTADWDALIAEHRRFGQAAGDRIRGGGALYPPAAATTVRLRGGELQLTGGPVSDTGEIANGLYVLSAPDREAAVALASQIPVGPRGCIELRQIVAE